MRIVIILISLVCLSMQGQTKSFSVKYGVEFILTEGSSESITVLNGIVNNLKKYEDMLTFELKVNNGFSKFGLIEQMSLDINKRLYTKLKIHSSGFTTFYQNHNEKFYIKEMSGSLLFTIKDNFKDFKWNINTKKQKLVLGYKCYFADGEAIIGSSSKPIGVWFTPSINTSVGPLHLNGLPGLILRIEEDKRTFTAKEIDLDENNKIIIPNFKETYTEAEFDEILKEKMKRFQR